MEPRPGLRCPRKGRGNAACRPPNANDGSSLQSSEPLSSVPRATAGPSSEGGSRTRGRRLAPGMKRKLLIALVLAGLLTAAVGPSTLPAGAAAHVITLKLLTGQVVTAQLPDGVPCEPASVPGAGAGAVVLSCTEVPPTTTPVAP